MKIEILKSEEVLDINWDKPQWMIYKDGNILVLTTGDHKEGEFEGTALPYHTHPDGLFAECWVKMNFQPIPEEGLTIKISNDE